MFDGSDSDDDSGSEFFGSRRGARGQSSSSSGSESEGDSQDAGGGLLAQMQQQRAQRSALAAAGAKRPIVMRMAPLPPALAPAAPASGPLPPPCKQAHALLPPPPLFPQPVPRAQVPLVGRGAPATERDPEGPPHVCFGCNLPIAIYGKLVCLHTCIFLSVGTPFVTSLCFCNRNRARMSCVLPVPRKTRSALDASSQSSRLLLFSFLFPCTLRFTHTNTLPQSAGRQQRGCNVHLQRRGVQPRIFHRVFVP